MARADSDSYERVRVGHTKTLELIVLISVFAV